MEKILQAVRDPMSADLPSTRYPAENTKEEDPYDPEDLLAEQDPFEDFGEEEGAYDPEDLIEGQEPTDSEMLIVKEQIPETGGEPKCSNDIVAESACVDAEKTTEGQKTDDTKSIVDVEKNELKTDTNDNQESASSDAMKTSEAKKQVDLSSIAGELTGDAVKTPDEQNTNDLEDYFEKSTIDNSEETAKMDIDRKPDDDSNSLQQNSCRKKVHKILLKMIKEFKEHDIVPLEEMIFLGGFSKEDIDFIKKCSAFVGLETKLRFSEECIIVSRKIPTHKYPPQIIYQQLLANGGSVGRYSITPMKDLPKWKDAKDIYKIKLKEKMEQISLKKIASDSGPQQKHGNGKEGNKQKLHGSNPSQNVKQTVDKQKSHGSGSSHNVKGTEGNKHDKQKPYGSATLQNVHGIESKKQKSQNVHGIESKKQKSQKESQVEEAVAEVKKKLPGSVPSLGINWKDNKFYFIEESDGKQGTVGNTNKSAQQSASGQTTLGNTIKLAQQSASGQTNEQPELGQEGAGKKRKMDKPGQCEQGLLIEGKKKKLDRDESSEPESGRMKMSEQSVTSEKGKKDLKKRKLQGSGRKEKSDGSSSSEQGQGTGGNKIKLKLNDPASTQQSQGHEGKKTLKESRPTKHDQGSLLKKKSKPSGHSPTSEEIGRIKRKASEERAKEDKRSKEALPPSQKSLGEDTVNTKLKPPAQNPGVVEKIGNKMVNEPKRIIEQAKKSPKRPREKKVDDEEDTDTALSEPDPTEQNKKLKGSEPSAKSKQGQVITGNKKINEQAQSPKTHGKVLEAAVKSANSPEGKEIFHDNVTNREEEKEDVTSNRQSGKALVKSQKSSVGRNMLDDVEDKEEIRDDITSDEPAPTPNRRRRAAKRAVKSPKSPGGKKMLDEDKGKEKKEDDVISDETAPKTTVTSPKGSSENKKLNEDEVGKEIDLTLNEPEPNRRRGVARTPVKSPISSRGKNMLGDDKEKEDDLTSDKPTPNRRRGVSRTTVKSPKSSGGKKMLGDDKDKEDKEDDVTSDETTPKTAAESPGSEENRKLNEDEVVKEIDLALNEPEPNRRRGVARTPVKSPKSSGGKNMLGDDEEKEDDLTSDEPTPTPNRRRGVSRTPVKSLKSSEGKNMFDDDEDKEEAMIEDDIPSNKTRQSPKKQGGLTKTVAKSPGGKKKLNDDEVVTEIDEKEDKVTLNEPKPSPKRKGNEAKTVAKSPGGKKRKLKSDEDKEVVEEEEVPCTFSRVTRSRAKAEKK